MKFIPIAVVLLSLVAWTAAQDGDAEPAMAEPTEQHALLEKKAGTWDATVEMPGTGVVGHATYTAKVDLGGLWLVGDYRGDFATTPFSGHDVTGYDSQRQRYVSIWVDSWVDHPMTLEGEYDAKTKTLALWTEGPDPTTGKPVKERHDHKFVDADTWSYTMNRAQPDGTFAPFMTITYKRKK